VGSIESTLAWTALPPLAAALAMMVVARQLGVRPRAAWAMAVGLGYVVGQAVVVGRTVGPGGALAKLARPHEARDWLPLLVLVAMGITLLGAAAPRTWQRWLVGLGALLCVAAPARLLGNSARVVSEWTTGERLSCLILLGAAMATVWLVLSTARDDALPRVRAVLLVLVAAGTALVMTRSGSFSYGQLAGVVGAAVAGAAVAAWRTMAPGVAGSAGVLTMSLGGLIVLGHFYAELSVATGALLVISLLGAGGWLPARVTDGPLWRQVLVRGALCLVPLAVAVSGRL
jgi:hypothetical protein